MTMPMSPTKPGLPPLVLTDDQFEDMARKGAFARVGRVELRDGVLTPMSPIHVPHGRLAFAFASAIKAALKQSSSALAVIGEVSIRFGRGFQPIPDVVVYERALVTADHHGPMPGPAVRLVIEVASASLNDDLGAKLAAYAAAGVPEYWAIDVNKRLVLQHAMSELMVDGWVFRDRRVLPFDGPIEALTLDLLLPADALND
jgi:Uma2 family endonuclease